MYQLKFNDKSVKLFNKNFLNANIRNVDLFITSPPYNVGINYDVYNDNLPYDKYLDFTKTYLKKCYDVSSKRSRICLNIPITIGSNIKYPVYADIVKLAQNLGWKYYSTIVWYKKGVNIRTAFGSFMSANAPQVVLPYELILILYNTLFSIRIM